MALTKACSTLVTDAGLRISNTSTVKTVEMGTQVDGVSASWNIQIERHAMDRQERMIDGCGKTSSVGQGDLLIEIEMDRIVMVGILRSCGIEKIEVEFDLTMLNIDVGELLMRMDHSLVRIVDEEDDEGEECPTRVRRGLKSKCESDALMVVLTGIAIVARWTETRGSGDVPIDVEPDVKRKATLASARRLLNRAGDTRELSGRASSIFRWTIKTEMERR